MSKVDKIAFTGHRDATAPLDALQKIQFTYLGARWLCGGADGVDASVEAFARAHGIETIVYLPDYSLYGRGAPLVRNLNMLAHCDILVAFYDGRLRGGTLFTINNARRLGIPVTIFTPDPIPLVKPPHKTGILKASRDDP
jgi:hypothetical protein